MATIDKNLATALAKQNAKILNSGTSDGVKKAWESRHIGVNGDAVAQHIHTAVGMNHGDAVKTRMAGGNYFSTQSEDRPVVGHDYLQRLNDAGWKVDKSTRGVGGVFSDLSHTSGAKAGIVVDNDGKRFDIQHADPAPDAVSEHAEELSKTGAPKEAARAHEDASYAHYNAGNKEKGKYHDAEADKFFAKAKQS